MINMIIWCSCQIEEMLFKSSIYEETPKKQEKQNVVLWRQNHMNKQKTWNTKIKSYVEDPQERM